MLMPYNENFDNSEEIFLNEFEEETDLSEVGEEEQIDSDNLQEMDFEESEYESDEDFDNILDDDSDYLDEESELEKNLEDIPSNNNQKQKICVLNGLVETLDKPSHPINGLVGKLLSDLNMDEECCEEIKLFQLNINPVTDSEQLDGMVKVYDCIRESDIVVVVTDTSSDGLVSTVLQNALSRISNYYNEGQLKNKVFSSIVSCKKENCNQVKNYLSSFALDNGFLLSADCMYFNINDDTSEVEVDDISSTSICIKKLSETTIDLRNIGAETEHPLSGVMDYEVFDKEGYQGTDDDIIDDEMNMDIIDEEEVDEEQDDFSHFLDDDIEDDIDSVFMSYNTFESKNKESDNE